MTLPPLKPHQQRGIESLAEHRDKQPGVPAVGVAPPGAGKSRVMIDLAKDEMEKGGRTIIYYHRKMLGEQLGRNFDDAGVPYSMVTADNMPDFSKPVLIASVNTIHNRCFKQQKWSLPDVSLVMKDEAHQQAASRSREVVFGSLSAEGIIEGHKQRGADILGMTATPLMRAGLYQRLIEFGTYSELRKQGMHLPVRVFSGEEIDTAKLNQNASGEYAVDELEKRAPVIFGSAYNEWRKLNPDARPALLYAPSVPCSKWFTLEWAKKGVMTAHIDGKEILMPSRDDLGRIRHDVVPSDPDVRAELLRMHESGEISVISNRFVLREAIDMPYLYHAIFATVMGGLTTFLQSVGRIQRYHSAYDYKILQCHGGSPWRHGSPNEDRIWKLGQTNTSMRKDRERKVGSGEADEGIRCEECGAIRKSTNPKCWNCEKSSKVSVRAVRQIDGKLKPVKGKVHKQRSKSTGKSAGDLWRSVWYASGHHDRTIKQAIANWQHKCRYQGIYPDWSQLNPPPPPIGSYEYETKMMQDVFPKLKQIVKRSKR